jgi:hypothetical protein
MFLLNRVDMTEVILQWWYLLLFGLFNFKL